MTFTRWVSDAARWVFAPVRAAARFVAVAAGTFRRWFVQGLGLHGFGQRVAGMTVNDETALTLPAYLAVIRVLAQTVAMLPRSVYVREARGRRKIPRHHVSRLIANPCPDMIPMAFWETLISWACSGGYGRALIIRDPVTADPVEMWPIEPWRIELRWVDGQPWYYWQVDPETDGKDGTRILHPSEVFDLHGLGSNGYCGYSLVAYGAQTIGTGLARQQYAASYFGNGVWGSGYVKTPGQLSDKAYQRMRSQLDEKYAGPENSFRPLLFEEGAEWHTLAIPNDDAQLIESGQFSVLEICRLAGVPPHKVFALERMTWSNIEHMQIEWRQDGVMPWTTRIEQEIQRKLIHGGFRSALYARHNLDGLERGDLKTRMEAHKAAIFSAIRTPNEVRALEEMDAVGEEGDELYIQTAMAPLKDVHVPPEPPAPPPMPAAPPPPDGDDEEDADAMTTVEMAWSYLMPVLRATALRVVRREAKTLAKVSRDSEGRLDAWARRWYAAQRERIVGEFAPSLASLAQLSGAATPNMGPVCDWYERTGYARAMSGDEIDESEVAEALLNTIGATVCVT